MSIAPVQSAIEHTSKLSQVRVEGLFGHISHSVDLRVGEPTILTGPNGVGKTHVLVLIRAALAFDLRTLAEVPFTALELHFDGNTRFLYVQRENSTQKHVLRISARQGSRAVGKIFEIPLDEIVSVTEVPSFLEYMGENRWFDGRAGAVISQRLAESRYGVKAPPLKGEQLSDYPTISKLIGNADAILVDTKRLDTLVAQRDRGASYSDASDYRRGKTSRIQQYINQIRSQIEEARRASVIATQSADLSFASRALAAARQSINENKLHGRYDEIVRQYAELSRNGLAIGEEPLEFPPDTTPTIRRLLNVFLDDWENRLKPLRPVNTKLKLLRRILDEKMKVTGKKTFVTDRGMLLFRNSSGETVNVSKLSSGEQHLVALYAMLLFSANKASLILIDEPEISLHAAWKHAFLQDISEVATLSDLQVVLATHSSGIVNGRWDLTEELEFTPPGSRTISSSPAADDGLADAVESEDDFE